MHIFHKSVLLWCYSIKRFFVIHIFFSVWCFSFSYLFSHLLLGHHGLPVAVLLPLDALAPRLHDHHLYLHLPVHSAYAVGDSLSVYFANNNIMIFLLVPLLQSIATKHLVQFLYIYISILDLYSLYFFISKGEELVFKKPSSSGKGSINEQ